MSVTAPSETSPTVQERAGALLANVAGYVGHRTVSIGLRSGLIDALAAHRNGLDSDELAEVTGHDPFYVDVWGRAAIATGLAEPADGGYRLVEHASMLLLDDTSPAYIGGVFLVLEQPEIFDAFEQRLPTGERTWWDACSPDFLRAVGATGGPFYGRLIPGALKQIGDSHARLQEGGRVLDTACGTGTGLRLLLETYPTVTAVGADGDGDSLRLAEKRLEQAGMTGRFELVQTPLEELDRDSEFDLVTNNVSMHECRDMDLVAANIRDALRPGGWFVISDFPFPDTTDGLRTVPGRIMAGIQYFEAQIDDQLVPPSVYLDLLHRHGFRDVDTFALTPVHAVVHGRA